MKWESILKRLKGERFLMRRVHRAIKSLNYQHITLNMDSFYGFGHRHYNLIYSDNLTAEELGDLIMTELEERFGDYEEHQVEGIEIFREAFENPSRDGFKPALFELIQTHFRTDREVMDLVSKYPNDMVLAQFVYHDKETRTFKFIDGSPEMYAKIVEESEEHRRPIE